MQHKGRSTQTTHWILEHWHSIWQSHQYINHPTNLPTIKLSHWRWTLTACKQPPVNNLYLQCTHLFCSIFLLGILTSATLKQESWESILFHQVLKAYPTQHSWIITAHITLGDFEKQLKMFIQQKARSQQLLNSIQQKPLAPNCLLSALQAELTNLDNIYTSL